jgi:hypothetical protein
MDLAAVAEALVALCLSGDVIIDNIGVEPVLAPPLAS